jgi:dienelactone hydrolase
MYFDRVQQVKEVVMKQIILLMLVLSFSLSAEAADRSVDYTIGDDAFSGWYIAPSSDAPLVVIVHDWDGLTGYEIKRAEMLYDLGYAVFCADLFGAGVRPTETADKQRLTGELYADRAEMRRRMNGALAAAKEQGAHVENAVVIGYCFGGTAALEWARSGVNLKGFAPFHGGLDTPPWQDYSQVQGEIIVFHGTADKMIAMDDFASLANQLEAAGVSHEMITYSGAPHAFSVFGSDRYRKDADQKSWRRFIEFLEDVLR